MTRGLQKSANSFAEEEEPVIDRNPIVVQSDLPISQLIALLLERLSHSSSTQGNHRSKAIELNHSNDLEQFSDYLKSSLQPSYALVAESNRIIGVITIQDLIRAKALKKEWHKLTVAEVMRNQTKLISGTRLKLFFKTYLHFKNYWLHYLTIVNEDGSVQGVITPERLQQALPNPLEKSVIPSIDQQHQGDTMSPAISPHNSNRRSRDLTNHETACSFVPPPQTPYEALAQGTVTIQHLERQLKQQALEVEELHQNLQWQSRSKAVLDTVAHTIERCDSASLQPILDRALVDSQEFLQADRVLVYQYQPDWCGFVLAEVAHEGLLRLQSFLIRDGLVSDRFWIQHYQNGECCVVANLEEDSNQLSTKSSSNFDQSITDLLHFFEVKAVLAVPILVKNKLWGLLVVHHCSKPHSWNTAEIDFAKSLTCQFSIAIDRSTLSEKNQQLKIQLNEKEKEYTTNLNQTLAYAEMLQRITDRVRDSLDEQQILQTAVQELVTVLGVGCGQAVLCCNRNCDECKSCYQSVNYPTGSCEDHKLAILPDLHSQLRRGEHCQFCLCEPFLNRGLNAILVCPIFDNQVYLGYLVLFANRSHQFEDAELRVVQQVADHCAIAIRQAHLYEASQAQVRELERLNQLKDDFLSTVSHELRTPLSSIKLVTNLLKIAFEQEFSSIESPTNTRIGQYFNVLQAECDREIKLVSDLLAVQNLNAGNHPINPSKTNLNEWLPPIIAKFNHRTCEQQQHLELQLPEQPLPIVCDLFMLDRILTELINNACKYTPRGEYIRVALTPLPTCFQLQISNTGTEIAPDQIPHIFKPFYRIPSNDPWKQGGTGLGLSLIKKIVEYLNGSLWVESEAGQVHFFVELPLQTSAKLVEENHT